MSRQCCSIPIKNGKIHRSLMGRSYLVSTEEYAMGGGRGFLLLCGTMLGRLSGVIEGVDDFDGGHRCHGGLPYAGLEVDGRCRELLRVSEERGGVRV